jgi:hypothetical protein
MQIRKKRLNQLKHFFNEHFYFLRILLVIFLLVNPINLLKPMYLLLPGRRGHPRPHVPQQEGLPAQDDGQLLSEAGARLLEVGQLPVPRGGRLQAFPADARDEEEHLGGGAGTDGQPGAGRLSLRPPTQPASGVRQVEFLKPFPVLRIRIHVFLSLLDPDPDPSVRGMDPYPDLDPSIAKQTKVRKTLIPTVFDFLLTF